MTTKYRKKEKLDRRLFIKYAGSAIIALAAVAVGYYWYSPKDSGHVPKKDYVESLVKDAINLIEEKGEESFPEFRKEGGKWYHDDYYIFVWTINGVRVVYPPDPSGEGKNMSDLEDINGKPIGKLFIDIATSDQGEGWIDYEWAKPGETKPSRKNTFIKIAEFENIKYLVGSGYYLD
jgi:signal transduction histidine kinase